MSRLLHCCLRIALLTLLAGCFTMTPGRDVHRAAVNVPDRFAVGSFTDPSHTEPSPTGGCRNPMVDPRDGTRLRLVRSADARGDYAVPDERYGVQRGELLRLDCRSGAVLGIVRR